MGGLADTFSTLTVLYLLAGGFTIYRLSRTWRAFVWGEPTPANQQTAGAIAFFLLVPVGVLLHEIGHMLAAWSVGGQVLGLHYFVYWGYVEYVPATGSALEDWYVALAGNFMSYALGVASLAASAAWRSLRPNLRLVLFQLGVLELIQTLIFYPLLSLDPGFYGDWDSIYSFRAPIASALTLGLHLASLAAFVLVLRRGALSSNASQT